MGPPRAPTKDPGLSKYMAFALMSGVALITSANGTLLQYARNAQKDGNANYNAGLYVLLVESLKLTIASTMWHLEGRPALNFYDPETIKYAVPALLYSIDNT